MIVLLLGFACLIPSSWYFFWDQGLDRGLQKSKEYWFEENDQTLEDEVQVLRAQPNMRNHTTEQPYLSVAPMEGNAVSVNRVDSFRMSHNYSNMPPNRHNTVMGIVEEESNKRMSQVATSTMPNARSTQSPSPTAPPLTNTLPNATRLQ